MLDDDPFWDFFWEMRLQAIQDLGKREAILAVSKLIRNLTNHSGKPLNLLELGCGEGQIIGALLDAHPENCSITASVGVDRNSHSLEKCRRNYPGLQLVQGDFTDLQLLSSLGQFDIVLLVNALHEVFSGVYSQEMGEIDVPDAKKRVKEVFEGAAMRVPPGGNLVLFDGLEPPGNPNEQICIQFRYPQARDSFQEFAQEYQPFRISYREFADSFQVELSRRDFSRYITKSIFLGKPLWETERLESYQYFNEAEFRESFESQDLIIQELRTLTVNYETWNRMVAIETPGIDFPAEHILILAQRRS